MSLRSPRRGSGFQQIPMDNSSYPHDVRYDTEIPLTNVRTGSTTGGRRPGDTIAPTMSRTPLNDENGEKSGFFKHRGPAGRRKTKSLERKGTDGEDVSMNSMGRLYHKIVNFSVVTRYLVYVLPVAIVLAIPVIIYAVLHPEAEFASLGVRVYLFWTWIEVVWLSLWVSKLLSKTAPFIFMFLCGVVSSGTRKYASIIRAVEIPLSMVGWSVASLATFTALMSPHLNWGNTPRWVDVVKKLLGPALIASIIYLIEQLFIQLISINYHRRSFDARIKDSKHAVHLLGLLFDASRNLFPMYCPEFVEEDYLINDSIEAYISKNAGHRTGHAKSGSVTPLRLIGNVGRIGDKVTTVFGNIASEVTGKQVFNPTSAHSIVVEALEKTRSSEALAKRLWMSFVVEGKEALYQEDIREVLGPASTEEADEAFASLDADGNGDISLDEMILRVIEVGRERKAISASMRDVGQAIGVLDQIISAILLIIILFIFVAFQDTNFVTTLATAGTTLLSLSFVFAVTAQEFLGSCIFLFVKHPYDVGDRVDIMSSTSQLLVVEQISLLYTIFKRIDTMKLVQVPNIVLNSLWIENVTRSKAMKEQLDMFISFDTSLEDIDLLRTEMENFVRHPDNSRDFQPDIVLEAAGIGNMDKLQLKIEIRHKSNWHNETVRASRRSKFMCALVLALRKIPIYAPGGGNEALGSSGNPGYSVAVSDSWAEEAREKASQKKEAKRLVPTTTTTAQPAQGDESSLNPEVAAASALNARRPTLDTAHEEITRSGSSRSNGPSSPRDESPETRRSAETDAPRGDLIHRKSTRGRRKPGYAPSQGVTPSLSISQPSPRMDAYPPRDEEAELGIHELSGQSGAGMEGGYESYRAPYQAAYQRYPQGQDGQQLLGGQGQARTQRKKGEGDKEEEFI